MMAVRDKTQADFDLERLFDMLDRALTSQDPRIQDALRGLLTIVELTRPQDDGHMAIETSHGPLRQMQEDLKHISRRLNNLEGEVRQMGTKVSPAPNPYTNPGGLGPIWTTSKSSSSYTLTDEEKDALGPQSIKITK